MYIYNTLEPVIIFVNAMSAGHSTNNCIETTVLPPNFVFPSQLKVLHGITNQNSLLIIEFNSYIK